MNEPTNKKPKPKKKQTSGAHNLKDKNLLDDITTKMLREKLFE